MSVVLETAFTLHSPQESPDAACAAISCHLFVLFRPLVCTMMTTEMRQPEKLRGWLCGIVKNQARRRWREEGRDPASNAATLDDGNESATGEALPSEQAVSREEEAILWRSLEKIPENYREPLILFYREHQSVEKVAAVLNYIVQLASTCVTMLVILNVHFDTWAATWYGVSTTEIHGLVPTWMVPMLTLILALWAGLFLALTSGNRSQLADK